MKFVLSIFILLFSGNVFADVTAEILSYKIDENGNVEVHSQYQIDGVEIESRYPQEDGKYYWVTRYNFFNFLDMSNDEIETYILEDLKKNAEGFLVQDFTKKENAKIIDKFKSLDFIAKKATATEAKIPIDFNKDSVSDEEWTLRTDGTKTVEDLTP